MVLNLDRLAATVERYMLDEIRIERKTGEIYNPATMKVETTWTTVYEGKAMISPMGDPAKTDHAGEDVQRTQYEISIPKGSPEPLENDRITVTVAQDPTMLTEERIYIRGIINGTFYTHRRFKAFKDRTDT